MDEYNLILVGFGKVGRELARLLLRGEVGLPLRITGVASSRGAVIVGGPGDLVYLLRLAERGEPLDSHPSFREGISAVEAGVLANAHVAAVTLPPNYATGEPNKSIVYGLMEEGISIVTADKTVAALDYRGLVGKAEEKNLYLGLRATVAAGTPAVDAARGLRLRGVRRIRAVLNATTNYILGLVLEGLSYREAIAQAREAGLAEPDPTVDTHGWDPAAKLVILSNVLGKPAELGDVVREPLDSVPEDLVREEASRGRRVKYVAEADYEKGTMVVEPRILDPGDPLAQAEGEENVIVFDVEDRSILLRGPAGPAWRTARVLLTDLEDYLWYMRIIERSRSPGE